MSERNESRKPARMEGNQGQSFLPFLHFIQDRLFLSSIPSFRETFLEKSLNQYN
jgi:hypothetical protein